jgi:hypothetical protein
MPDPFCMDEVRREIVYAGRKWPDDPTAATIKITLG